MLSGLIKKFLNYSNLFVFLNIALLLLEEWPPGA